MTSRTVSSRSMPFEFSCQACAKLLRVPEGTHGKKTQCPGCGIVLEIPEKKKGEPDRETTATIAICIPCPKCHQELLCEPALLGTKGQCRNCKHIFLITEDSTKLTATAVTNYIFNCPKCSQLFEGRKSMQGRRGKCHTCGEIFKIQLKPLNTSPGLASAPAQTSPQPQTDARPANPSTVLDRTPPAASPHGNPRPSVQRGDSPTPMIVATPVVRPEHLPPIQFSCHICFGVLEVPGDSAQQITFCPFCKEQLEIPSSLPLSGPFH